MTGFDCLQGAGHALGHGDFERTVRACPVGLSAAMDGVSVEQERHAADGNGRKIIEHTSAEPYGGGIHERQPVHHRLAG